MSDLQEQFNEVIRLTQGVQDPQTDELFSIWEKNKAKFIDCFGGLIYEYPEKVRFELDPEDKEESIDGFVNLAKSYYHNEPLADFVSKQREGFFENKTLLDARGADGKIIKKGTRLVKAFRHFAEGNELVDLQNEASRVIQDNKMEGILCFSVHPLDFLTLSENDYNWTSCHALDGEYRAGNLSYMADKVTFICYLKGDTNIKLTNDIRWNNKKWRVLMYLDEYSHLILTGRQYPFDSTVGMNLILEKGLAAAGIRRKEDLWTPWQRGLNGECPVDGLPKQSVQLKNNYIVYNDAIRNIHDIVKDAEGSCQYNDTLKNNTYRVWYAYAYAHPLFNSVLIWPKTAKLPLEVGSLTYCLECGRMECLSGQSTMRCIECELEYGTEVGDIITVCDECGRRILTEESYCVQEECLCEDCFRELTTTCDVCYQSYFNDELIYDECREKYVCNECRED